MLAFGEQVFDIFYLLFKPKLGYTTVIYPPR